MRWVVYFSLRQMSTLEMTASLKGAQKGLTLPPGLPNSPGIRDLSILSLLLSCHSLSPTTPLQPAAASFTVQVQDFQGICSRVEDIMCDKGLHILEEMLEGRWDTQDHLQRHWMPWMGTELNAQFSLLNVSAASEYPRLELQLP